MSRTGQEIFYCSTCRTQVRGTDFDHGRAFRVKDKVFCRCCRPEALRGSADGSPSGSRTPMKVPTGSRGQYRKFAARQPNQVPEGLMAAIAAAVVVVGAVVLLRPSDARTLAMMPIEREADPPLPPEVAPVNAVLAVHPAATPAPQAARRSGDDERVRVLPLQACRFDGSERRLQGKPEEGSLDGVTVFPQWFSGLERSEPFTVPAEGELRATYFLRSPTRLSFRLGIQRGSNQSVPHEVVLEHPTVGVATEIRIPFSQFKAFCRPGTPAVVPGDQTTMIHIFGEAIDCGLRLDALSLVELRPPEK
jgi:hypothetical protein